MKNSKIFWGLIIISILLSQVNCDDNYPVYDHHLQPMITDSQRVNVISFSQITLVQPDSIFFELTQNSDHYRWGHLRNYDRDITVTLEIDTSGNIVNVTERGFQLEADLPLEHLQYMLPRIWQYNGLKAGELDVRFIYATRRMVCTDVTLRKREECRDVLINNGRLVK